MSLAGFSGAAVLGLVLVGRDWSHPPVPAAQPVPVAGGAVSALRLHLDPKTGQFTSPPVATQALARVQAPVDLNTSHEGLVEEPSPVPGGGFMVNLQGRFQSRMVVEMGTNGTLRQRCEMQGATK